MHDKRDATNYYIQYNPKDFLTEGCDLLTYPDLNIYMKFSSQITDRRNEAPAVAQRNI